jgi:hypothetical protein
MRDCDVRLRQVLSSVVRFGTRAGRLLRHACMLTIVPDAFGVPSNLGASLKHPCTQSRKLRPVRNRRMSFARPGKTRSSFSPILPLIKKSTQKNFWREARDEEHEFNPRKMLGIRQTICSRTNGSSNSVDGANGALRFRAGGIRLNPGHSDRQHGCRCAECRRYRDGRR